MNYSKLFIAAALSAWCGTSMQSGTSRTPMPMITAESNASATDITLTDQGDYQTESYENKHVRVEGKTNLFLTGNQPLSSSTIDLNGDEAWLYFTQIKPSKVKTDWLQYVTINGKPFDAENDRIAIYGSGTVIIPSGMQTAQEALTVYTGKNFTGDSQSYEINTYHNQLGKFDNRIQSFKLKKGFAATLANNPDGTGFSRMFIASDEDVEFPEMPEGMEGFVSFIRVFKWEWTGKKGWAGGPSDQVNVSVFYDWDAGGDTENIDREYVPMRHNLGWQSFEVINSRNNVSHLLGYNEPDRSDQSNMSVAHAIEQWPEMFKSGLRLGSPAPSSTPKAWLTDFMAICDSLNYRVDFVVTHAYQHQATSWWDWNIGATSRTANGRPVWITEWNNGANWTGESWPDASGPQRDANMNIIYDENGEETIVNKPLSPDNAEHSKQKIEQLLPFFDSYDLLEHHFLYNWVQDARSMILNDELTPAGKVFADFKSEIGFKKANEYIHKWKIAPPWIVTSISEDYKNIILRWYDHNGETGKNYILQRKIGDGEFKNLKIFTVNSDYQYADTLEYTDPIENEQVTYRVYAVSYKDTRSLYSRCITIAKDPIAAPPTLTGEAISATILHLKWETSPNARSYRIERSTSPDGKYETVADYCTATEFVDKGLADGTSYYYRIYSLNTGGTSVASAPLEIKTKELTVPNAMTGLRAASGDKNVTLTWDFVYDALYNIYRSEPPNGEYIRIASDIEVEENNARYRDEYEMAYDQTYYYKVIAHNREGEAPESEIVKASPKAGQCLHLTFNEGDGPIVFDEWGGFHAQMQNNPTWNTITEGDSTKSVVYLNKNDKSYLQLPKGVVSELTDQYTISSWIYLPEDQGNNTRMFDFGQGTGRYMVFIPQASTGQSRFKLTYPTDEGTKTFDVTFNFGMELGKWNHVAYTVGQHPQGGLMYMFYLNGKMVSFARDEEYAVPAGMGETENNYLGRSQWSSDPYCSHGYKDFRIYNQTLSAADIQKLYEGEEPILSHIGTVESIPNETRLTLTPNPAIAGETVDLKVANTLETPKQIKLGIYDLTGNQIASRTLNEYNAIFTAPATSGIYIVKVTGNGFTQSCKLIVK